MGWWEQFWLETYSGVAAGLVVLGVTGVLSLIASLVKKNWREKVWGNVAKFFRWLRTVRLTTISRVEADRKQAETKGFQAATKKLSPIIADAQSALARVQSERDELKSELDTAHLTLKARGQGFSALRPAVPPAPRWELTQAEESYRRDRVWVIQNLMPDSVAFNVRVEISPKGRFVHQDPAFWVDLSGISQGVFGGSVTGLGAVDGYTVNLTWFDQDQNELHDSWQASPIESRPDPF